MGELPPLPRAGDVCTDARGDDRTMRVGAAGNPGAGGADAATTLTVRAPAAPVDDVPVRETG